MFENFSLFPRGASTHSGHVDALYLSLIGMSVFFVLLIVTALLIFSFRYRRGRTTATVQIHGSIGLELLWTAIPLAIVLAFFGWGARLYFESHSPPADAMQFTVTGKQWMWKIQHPTGQREINTLHIPAGQPIVLTMISEDVIHDFFVPAFRVKNDVLPGTYTRVWFEATRIGTYHLFCAEYCGTNHSAMGGQVIVMDQGDYEQWLTGQPAGLDPVETGRVLFENQRCDTCHAAGSGQRGPDLQDKFGTYVPLSDGQTILFDEAYVRDSILEPKKHVVKGFDPVMPTYQGQLSEEQILALIAYIKSLQSPQEDGK